MIISYWGSAFIKLTLKSVPQLTQETGRSLIYLRKHGSRTEVTDRKTFFPDNAPTKYKSSIWNEMKQIIQIFPVSQITFLIFLQLNNQIMKGFARIFCAS